MPCLTTYTQKYVNASPQMNGLDSTFWNRFCKSESSSSFVSVVVVSVVSRSVFFESAGSSARSSGDSTGSKPLVSGESRSVRTMVVPNTSAIRPGAHSPHDQPSVRAAVPAKIGAANPPRLCAMFHMPQYVPRSAPANHAVSSLAHAGPPQPCSTPLSAQHATNHGRLEPQPKSTFTLAVSASPTLSIARGLSTSPTTPDTNFEQP